jgi:DNA (cytosine-5)-methyltransferase 1
MNRQGVGLGEDGDPSSTLTGLFVPGVATDYIVRRLTPIECERLQGFPDDWTSGNADSHRYKQMGNAVAVPVVEWIIQNICDTI